ncbi:NAD-dependent epimerase/dehydratase family protein [Dyadobacter luticola]|uniref:NAD-dependent dehydratase n=1 Tax=Dyadobacter luticola TaxID=1979387 RepID=A0A5R9KPG8_9BACT|nr:NAD-dependent epimerase/dehydratase family protein [Dyadobacter luticola]TLU98039.1 NAD-dependent dehydratase [Dyadobacter luticola]
MTDSGSKVEKKRISILGCGWLGFSLAQRLRRQPSTQEIRGSTTSMEKVFKFANNGIEAHLFDLNPGFPDQNEDNENFFKVDTLVISLPPRLTKNEPGFYPKQIEAVVEKIQASEITDILFISSTSVYPDLNRVMSETDVTKPEHSASPEMVLAENLVQALSPERNVTIARLAGLLGYNRIPGKYVQGQKNMLTGEIPVNYIHRDDAATILAIMIEKGLKNETYNIVAPHHPTRAEIYQKSCDQFGWEAPTYAQNAEKPAFKVISGEKLDKDFSYSLLYPDPLNFFYSIKDTL